MQWEYYSTALYVRGIVCEKIIIITACVCLLFLIITIPILKNFLLDFGFIHIPEKELISYFEKNKNDFKRAADYVLDKCTFFDENIETQGSDKEFKPGEVIEYINICYSRKGYYSCRIYNKITSDKNSNLLKEIEPYDISSEAESSFNKITKRYVRAVSIYETVNKSTYVNFQLKGWGFYDQQHIVYFKDKEHDLRFQTGYKVVPLSEEGWYYLALGDAENW